MLQIKPLLNRTMQVGIVIAGMVFASACFRMSPDGILDYPRYPEQALYVGAIEGYQTGLAGMEYNTMGAVGTDTYAYHHLLVQDHYLYAAQCGLTIFDITEPEQMTVVGNYRDTCGVDDVTVVNGRAFLAVRDRGVTVLDVSNPMEPKRIGVYEYLGEPASPPAGILVSGDYILFYTPQDNPAAVGANSDYTGWSFDKPVLQVIRMEGSGDRFRIEHVREIEGVARPMAIGAGVFYAAEPWYQDGAPFNHTALQTVKIQTDGMLEIVNTIIIPTRASDVRINGNNLFVAAGSRIWVWDVTDPGQPVRLTEKYNTYGPIGNFGWGIDVDDEKIAGAGYSLKYKRSRDTVYLRTFARTIPKTRDANCRVWMKPDAPCMLTTVENLTMRGYKKDILYGDYLFSPYVLLEHRYAKGEFVVSTGIEILRFP